MKKIAFLFGAGAEGKGNFNIRTGYDYLKSSLFAANTPEGFNNALSSFFGQKVYFNGKYVYRKDTLDASSFVLKNFVIQKASHDEQFYINHKNFILSLLSDEDIRHVCDVLDIADVPKHISAEEDILKAKKKIKDELKMILTDSSYKYSKITSPLLKELFKNCDDNIDLDINIGISGSLDSYFHTIIDPYKYSVIRFSKIFNYYWACYFTIVHDVVSFLAEHGKEEFEKYLTPDKNLNYPLILNNIEQFTKELYCIDIKPIAPPNTYYRLIGQKLEDYQKELRCVGVITTNYYRFCEVVSPNTIYLNGQLKFFEYPEMLEVMDITTEGKHEENTILFPFIFGQSLVKPIVSSVQTEEFHRLHELLTGKNGADILVVLGYNVNEDDNHINAFLHDYIKKGKKLIIVSGDDSFNATRKLKCREPDVSVCKVSYGNNEEVVENIFNEIMNIVT